MSEDLGLAPANETHDLAPNRGQSEVLSVIRHTIAPGKEPEYEAWLREIVPIAATARGAPRRERHPAPCGLTHIHDRAAFRRARALAAVACLERAQTARS